MAKNNKLEKQLKKKTRLNKFMTFGLPVVVILTLGLGFMITQNMYKRYSGESLKSAYIAKHTKVKQEKIMDIETIRENAEKLKAGR